MSLTGKISSTNSKIKEPPIKKHIINKTSKITDKLSKTFEIITEETYNLTNKIGKNNCLSGKSKPTLEYPVSSR